MKHIARLLLRTGRLASLNQLLSGKVILLAGPLDHPNNLGRLNRLSLDIGLHKSGAIYREPVINVFRLGILNPHIGILPAYRGRNVMEWSLLQGDPVGVTVFFIDSGIDTGERILISEVVDISNCRTIDEAKQQLFDADARFLRRAIERLQSHGFTFGHNDGSGRRYYVMSNLFRGVVQKLIEDGN
jgi:methionyl-tRNA formyltransferase